MEPYGGGDDFFRWGPRGRSLDHLDQQKPADQQQVAELAERLDLLFARACAKRPEDRYQSAREMLAALTARIADLRL